MQAFFNFVLVSNLCPHAAPAFSSQGQTPLHVASLYGHLDTAKILLEKGANAEAKDIRGRALFVCRCLLTPLLGTRSYERGSWPYYIIVVTRNY